MQGGVGDLTPPQLAVVQERVTCPVALFREMRVGNGIRLDSVPGTDADVSTRERSWGGWADDPPAALPRAWPRPKPVTDFLKNAMVGVDKD